MCGGVHSPTILGEQHPNSHEKAWLGNLLDAKASMSAFFVHPSKRTQYKLNGKRLQGKS